MNTQLSDITLAKGNIPIEQKVYKKYRSTNEIFENVPKTYNYDNIINIKEDIDELKGIDFDNLNIGDAKRLGNIIFKKYHNSNIIYNNSEKIYVSGSSISESIIKVYQSYEQRLLLKEHLLALSDLGDIIEQSILVCQTNEIKGRDKYNTWNYYFNCIEIGSIKYDIVIDVVSMANGENHYHIQRIQKSNI